MRSRINKGFPYTFSALALAATSLIPLNDGSCDFTVAAGRRTGPALDVHATAQYDRVFKEGGVDNVTTIYTGEGPLENYQTSGRIDALKVPRNSDQGR